MSGKRVKKEYSIDCAPYQELIQDFLVAASLSSEYAEVINRNAQTIKAKRKNTEEAVE